MAEKQRVEYNFLSRTSDPESGTTNGGEDDAMDVDNVKAMVSGVKARGVCNMLSCFHKVTDYLSLE